MKTLFLVGLVALTATVGCYGASSDDDDDDSSGGSAGSGSDKGGSSGKGGSASSGGSSSSGGSGGSTGGSVATGGTGGTAGSGGSGGMSTENEYPMGHVYSCFGTCPLGECDDDGFWADVSCTDTYAGDVDESSDYCGTPNDRYCLLTGSDSFDVERYAVNCTGGVATVDHCMNGCGFAGDEPAKCD